MRSYIDLFYINQCLLKFLVYYVFNKCVNKPMQNGYSSREGTIFPDVLGHPLLTVSNTDPVSINFLCHQ